MSSHFARLKEDLDAKQLDLQEEQAAVESIEKLRKELEAQEKALVAKSTELYNRQREVTSMQQRLDTLTAVEPGITAAMHTKSSTQDVVRHVIENAIRGDHMTGSEIVQMTLDTAMHVNGRSRDANLDDFLIDLIVDEKSVGAAVDAAAENLNIYHVLQRTVATAMRNGERSANLEDCFKMTMDLFVGKNGTAAESSKPQAAALKENIPFVPQSQATPINDNGLRGQAASFKPLSDPHRSYNAGDWQALAQSGQANGNGGGW